MTVEYLDKRPEHAWACSGRCNWEIDSSNESASLDCAAIASVLEHVRVHRRDADAGCIGVDNRINTFLTLSDAGDIYRAIQPQITLCNSHCGCVSVFGLVSSEVEHCTAATRPRGLNVGSLKYRCHTINCPNGEYSDC